jgi:hypothetical protein
MKSTKILLLIFATSLSLFGRSNPFSAVPNAQDIPIANNYIQPPAKFKKEQFNLPKTARIIESIEIIYQNIDGSISRKKVPVDKSVDWKKKFTLLYNSDIPKVRKPKKPKGKSIVTKIIKKRVEQTIDDRIVYTKKEEKKEVREKTLEKVPEKEVAITHQVETKKQNSGWDWNSRGGGVNWGSNTVQEEKKKKNDIPIDTKTNIKIGTPEISNFEFLPGQDRVVIKTEDSKKRHFMLVRPNRIIIDFFREVTLPNQTFKIEQGIFKEMKLSSNGSDSYRITIYIEDGYRYKLTRIKEGYEIECTQR